VIIIRLAVSGKRFAYVLALDAPDSKGVVRDDHAFFIKGIEGILVCQELVPDGRLERQSVSIGSIEKSPLGDL
jgi:hypothetical protein